jgi:hypothetical protein
MAEQGHLSWFFQNVGERWFTAENAEGAEKKPEAIQPPMNTAEELIKMEDPEAGWDRPFR